MGQSGLTLGTLTSVSTCGTEYIQLPGRAVEKVQVLSDARRENRFVRRLLVIVGSELNVCLCSVRSRIYHSFSFALYC